MKKNLIALSILFFTASLWAQEISVKSFKPLSSDLTARMNPVMNDNAQTCALVKIVTTEHGFEFDTDGLGMCKDVDETHAGEVWIWLAPGSRRLTIRHGQLGVLRNYEYPVAIESACTYEMVLTTAKITSIVEDIPKENYLALDITPSDAAIKIDENIEITQGGQFQKIYSVGTHKYEAFCEMYHPQQGTFDITADKTTHLSLNLKPNFGFLRIESEPEDDAVVYINGKQVGKTPYLSDKMESKTYMVQVAKDLFQNASKQVEVLDNQTVSVKLKMESNFAYPTITCNDAEAEIWINGEKKGIGRWSGRLPAGAYKLEARKESHRGTQKSETILCSDNRVITLEAPMPIYGKLNVQTTPFGVEIFLNDKSYGTTPQILNKVLIGNYKLTLQKAGYSSISKNIYIKENEMLEVNESFQIVAEEKNPLFFHCGDKIRDYDGNEYNTVQIGSQCWMKENMRTLKTNDGKMIPIAREDFFAASRFVCCIAPSPNDVLLKKYGYLYNYPAALAICPQGWHLPSMDDFETLFSYCRKHYSVGSDTIYIARSLAANESWDKTLSSRISNITGNFANTINVRMENNNASGFAAYPTGSFYYGIIASCVGVKQRAYFWTSTSQGSAMAHFMMLDYESAIPKFDTKDRCNGYSVRCIRDEGTSNVAPNNSLNPSFDPKAPYRPELVGGSGGGSGTGSGSGKGSGIGPGEGSGSGGGIGYGTGNRGYTYMPNLTVNEAGTVYVEVHVNADGSVSEARVINNEKYPTTIKNASIQAECVAKAKTAKYKSGKEELRIIIFK